MHLKFIYQFSFPIHFFSFNNNNILIPPHLVLGGTPGEEGGVAESVGGWTYTYIHRRLLLLFHLLHPPFLHAIDAGDGGDEEGGVSLVSPGRPSSHLLLCDG